MRESYAPDTLSERRRYHHFRLEGLCIPHAESRLGTDLTSRGVLSVWRDSHAMDVIVMVLVESLGVRLLIENYSASCGVVDNLSLVIIPEVVSGVMTSVSITVVELGS